MFNAPAGITFAATIEQPKCTAKLSMYDAQNNASIEIQCGLVAGHRQTRHGFTVSLPDDTTVEIYWTKHRTVK